MSFDALSRFIDALARWEAELRDVPLGASEGFKRTFEAALAALLVALRYEGFGLPDEEPKDVLKKAFTALWIDDAQLWLDMLAHGDGQDLPVHRLFAYFAELHRIAEVIKGRARVPTVVQDLAERIGHLPRVKRVILYGSRARGDNQSRSDVDLAVEAEDDEAIRSAKVLVEEAPTLLEIDLVAWLDATDDLRSEIETEGVVLFPRN